jgi:methoxymalonate biosynthesis acyl carrier protein
VLAGGRRIPFREKRVDRTAQIRQFLAEHIAEPVADEDDIFARGLVNSMFVVQLVAFLEETFDIQIDGEDLVFENFRSVKDIDTLVQRLAAP